MWQSGTVELFRFRWLTLCCCSYYAVADYADSLKSLTYQWPLIVSELKDAQSRQSGHWPARLQVQPRRRPGWSTEPAVHTRHLRVVRHPGQRASVLRWIDALLVSRGTTVKVHKNTLLYIIVASKTLVPSWVKSKRVMSFPSLNGPYRAALSPQLDTSRSRKRVLRAHGLQDSALHYIYRSVVLAKLLYASSSWIGSSNTTDRQKLGLQAFLNRSKRTGFCDSETDDFATLCSAAEAII